MPDAKFLEEYQLYRKFEFKLPSYFHEIKNVNINMYCPICEETRTFRFTHKYLHEEKPPVRTIVNRPILPPSTLGENEIIHLNYICASCENFNRMFSLRIGKNRQYIEKVGQFPTWDINIEKNLKEILKNYSENYKKGSKMVGFHNFDDPNDFFEIFSDNTDSLIWFITQYNPPYIFDARWYN